MTGARIAAVVLAAGMSSRFADNKLLQQLRGKEVVRHVAEAALASLASPVLVVTGYNADQVSAALAGLPTSMIENPDFSSGLSSSLRLGLSHVPPECDGALILLGDMPFVRPELLDALIGQFDPDRRREICVPFAGGRRGNPVLWGRRFFPELLNLTGDRGAKELLHLHEDVLFELEVPGDDALIDIDTPDDLRRHS